MYFKEKKKKMTDILFVLRDLLVLLVENMNLPLPNPYDEAKEDTHPPVKKDVVKTFPVVVQSTDKLMKLIVRHYQEEHQQKKKKVSFLLPPTESDFF